MRTLRACPMHLQGWQASWSSPGGSRKRIGGSPPLSLGAAPKGEGERLWPEPGVGDGDAKGCGGLPSGHLAETLPKEKGEDFGLTPDPVAGTRDRREGSPSTGISGKRCERRRRRTSVPSSIRVAGGEMRRGSPWRGFEKCRRRGRRKGFGLKSDPATGTRNGCGRFAFQRGFGKVSRTARGRGLRSDVSSRWPEDG